MLRARHSFVSTFVFYQSLAFAGQNAGELMAQVERGDQAVVDRVLAPARALGPIEIHISESEGDWRTIGTFGEAGPIASDRIVFPFDAEGTGPLRVRLRMAQGSWRIDEVSVASLDQGLDPVVLEPVSVLRDGRRDAIALDRLNDADRHLVTSRGDHYELRFELPGGAPLYELFLESEGFYYEWMRGAWLAEENSDQALMMMMNPSMGLSALAPAFKKVERSMEELFWASRFRR